MNPIFIRGTISGVAFRNAAQQVPLEKVISGELSVAPSVISKLQRLSNGGDSNLKAAVKGIATLIEPMDESSKADATRMIETKVELLVSKIRSQSDPTANLFFSWLYVGTVSFSKATLVDIGGTGSININGEFVFNLDQHTMREAGFTGSGFFLD